jgi:hypothetical protein
MGTETPISNVLAKISMNEDTVDKSSKNEVTVEKTNMDAAMLAAITAKITDGTISTIELLKAFVKKASAGVSSRTVLKEFFDMLASGVIKKPSAVGPGLAKDVSDYMSKDKNITDFNTLEILLESLLEAEVHGDALSWEPKTGKEQEALMQYITGDCARFWSATSGGVGVKLAPGFWLMLKIRQELCAHVLSSDNF